MYSREQYEAKARQKYDDLQERTALLLRSENVVLVTDRIREINTSMGVRLNENWRYEVNGVERKGLHAVLPRTGTNVPPERPLIQRCRLQGLRHGQHVHAQVNRWCKGMWPLLSSSSSPIECDCLLHIIDVLEQNNYLPVASELPVWNADVNVCTAIDLMCIDAVTAKWHLLELKTSTSGNTNRPQHFLQVLLARELLTQADHYRLALPSSVQCLLLEVLPDNLTLLRRMPSYVVKQARLRYLELRRSHAATRYARRYRNTREARRGCVVFNNKWRAKSTTSKWQTSNRASAKWKPKQRRY